MLINRIEQTGSSRTTHSTIRFHRTAINEQRTHQHHCYWTYFWSDFTSRLITKTETEKNVLKFQFWYSFFGRTKEKRNNFSKVAPIVAAVSSTRAICGIVIDIETHKNRWNTFRWSRNNAEQSRIRKKKTNKNGKSCESFERDQTHSHSTSAFELRGETWCDVVAAMTLKMHIVVYRTRATSFWFHFSFSKFHGNFSMQTDACCVRFEASANAFSVRCKYGVSLNGNRAMCVCVLGLVS